MIYWPMSSPRWSIATLLLAYWSDYLCKLAASGARILYTVPRQLEHSGGRYALVTMCIGIGQGIAIIIEWV